MDAAQTAQPEQDTGSRLAKIGGSTTRIDQLV
uniref:NAC020 n=1 Tax=Arundo donax TaxID=35708 RepID=A0A0A9E5P6_ARUDO